MASTRRGTAIVTGGAHRLGGAISEALLRKHYSVVLHYFKSADAAMAMRQRYGDQVTIVQGDLRDPSVPALLVQTAVDRYGALELLVNSAATFYPAKSLADMEAAWDDFQAINVRAAFRCIRAATDFLKMRQGSVVNIVDIFSTIPRKSYTPYCISKAGIAMLTKVMALELAPDVRVNGVSPGAILPPADDASESVTDRLRASTPLGRMGTPEDIASGVLYLAHAPFVTGQILAVDGGRSLSGPDSL